MLSLLRRSLGGERTERFWRWKHEQNPFGRSPVLLAFDDDKLVGLRAFMRWTFNGSIRAVRAVDTVTDPEYRGRGIFTLLTKRLIEEVDAEFVFNTPNAKSGPGYEKLGWERLGRIDVWARPALGMRGATGGAVTPYRRDDDRLHTVHTPESLAWRYTDGYETHVAERAAAVTRRKGRELRVVDLFIDRKGVVEAAMLLHRVATTAFGVMTAVARIDTPQGRALALGGFVPVPRAGPMLMARSLRGRARKRKEWAVSLGDLELF